MRGWVRESGDEFNVDETDHVTVSARFTPAEDTFSVSTSVSSEADAGRDGADYVDLGATRSVVFTAQLEDDEMATLWSAKAWKSPLVS